MALDPALEACLLEVTGQLAASQRATCRQETCYQPETSTSRRLTSRRLQTASPMTSLCLWAPTTAGVAGTDPPGYLPCQTGASLPTVTVRQSSRHAISAVMYGLGVPCLASS